MNASATRTFTDVVKRVVQTIPPGEVLSYREVAIRAGNPRAYRAVARIMSQNYDLSVPCHRVIKSDGSLGGYNRGGPEKKRELLEIESKMSSQ